MTKKALEPSPFNGIDMKGCFPYNSTLKKKFLIKYQYS